MFNRIAIGFSLPILVLSLAVLPAFAHHGWGGNQNEEFEIAGTVAKGVSLAGPHATMQINVDGQVLGYHAGAAGPDEPGGPDRRDHSDGCRGDDLRPS